MPSDTEEKELLKTLGSNAWRMWEGLPRDAKPKYRWRKTWMDHPGAKPGEDRTDITGYLDGVQIGRVFQLEDVANHDAWFWVLNPPIKVHFWRPIFGSGWEKSMNDAACRVEWCHDAMMASLSNFPQYARPR